MQLIIGERSENPEIWATMEFIKDCFEKSGTNLKK